MRQTETEKDIDRQADRQAGCHGGQTDRQRKPTAAYKQKGRKTDTKLAEKKKNKYFLFTQFCFCLSLRLADAFRMKEILN